MKYIFTYNNKKYESYSAMDIVASFLFEKQVGNNPKWEVYPGDSESITFYTLSDKEGMLYANPNDREVLLFESEHDAQRVARTLYGYDTHMGCCTSDGLVAGTEDMLLVKRIEEDDKKKHHDWGNDVLCPCNYNDALTYDECPHKCSQCDHADHYVEVDDDDLPF